MKKLRTQKRVVSFTVGNNDSPDLETLLDLVRSPEGADLGIHRAADGRGVTFGRGRQWNEYDGEGLPDAESAVFRHDFSIAFDVRLAGRENGDLELTIAKQGASTHFKYQFAGLKTHYLATLASNEFSVLVGTVIKESIYHLAWACYRKQDDDKRRKTEALEKILANFAVRFRPLLTDQRWKVIETMEKEGVTVETSIPIEAGRRPEINAGDLKSNCIAAFAKLEVQKLPVTQDNVGGLVFPDAGPDLESVGRKLRGALKTNGLRWKEVLAEYREITSEHSNFRNVVTTPRTRRK